MTWDQYLKPGFDALLRYQSTTIDAKFVQGENGMQLELYHRVEHIEAPADADIPATYKTWYSLGAKASRLFQIIDDGKRLWSNDPSAAFTETGKMGKLIRQVQDLNAPMIHGQYPPTEAIAWIGLQAIWEHQEIKYEGLSDSAIDLPVQIVGQGAPVGVSSNGAVPVQQPVAVAAPVAAPPQAAPPPAAFVPPVAPPPAPPTPAAAPPPPAASIPPLSAYYAGNLQVWKDYFKANCQGKTRQQAYEWMVNDTDACQADAETAKYVVDGTIFLWLEAENVVKEVGGVLA